MTGISSHDACIGNLSSIAAITNAIPALRGPSAQAKSALAIASFDAAAIRNLGANQARPETLSRFGMMAMLGSLTVAVGRLPQLPAGGGSNPDPLASLRNRLAGLRAALIGPALPASRTPSGLALPQFQWPGGWQGAALLAASRALAPLGIDIFSPGGGVALATLVGRLDAQGIFGQMARPGIPAGLVTDLQRLGSLGAGFSLLQGRLPPQTQPPAWPGGLGGLENFLRAGPIGLLCSPGGRDLLPNAAEMAGIGDRLRHLQNQKDLGALLPASLRLPGGGIADPVAAFERSGCCAVLSKVSNLQAAGTGARRIEGATAGITAIRQGFSIDPAARDAPQRLSRAVEEMEQAAARLPQGLSGLLDSPDVPRAAATLSALLQAKAQGIPGL
jgi:hypothetical protein